MPDMAIAPEALESLTVKFAELLPHLDERQQRLCLAAEARSLGRGGISAVAKAAGVSRQTVADGVAELDRGDIQLGRIRRSGGGRKRLADLNPQLRPALLLLIEPGTVEPTSSLRWTTKSTRRLAEELTSAGYRIAADTVGNLLREEGFALHAHPRTIAGGQQLNRDEQFRHVNEQAAAHHAAGHPVICVRCRRHQPTHPCRATAADQPLPRAVLGCATQDVAADRETAALALDSIRRWWHGQGRPAMPTAGKLLVVADEGGPDIERSSVWRRGLARLAAESGLTITVCHLPPGTTKWNTIEYRDIAVVTTNAPDHRATTHEIVVATIAAANAAGASTDGTATPPPLPPGEWNCRLHPG